MRRNSRHGNDTMQLTPMIDVMVVLLAVFMFTTPMMTNGIDLDLPKAGSQVLSSSDYSFKLSVDKNGNYYLSENKMALDKIILKLAAIKSENPKMTVTISGDKSSDYGAVMRALGGLKDAGFDRVSLETKSK